MSPDRRSAGPDTFRGYSTLRYCLVVAAAGAALFTPAAAHAWWSTGHMVVARIAYDRLDPKVRAECNRLLAIDARPESATFVTAACWADDLKSMDVHAYDTWHYVDVPFSPDGTPVPKELDHDNVRWAMDQCVRTLSSPKAPDVEKARMLRFLIHFVGDVHQPLHCVSRYTKDHLTGDAGGNLFPLAAGHAHNLHAYWDSGAGMYEDVARPLTPAGDAAIAKLAAEAVAALPAADHPEAADQSVDDWVRSGVELAQSAVYKIAPGDTPSAEYAASVRDCARRQVALAGYRLAALLNRILAAPRVAAAHT